MDNTLKPVVTRSGKSQHCDPSLQQGRCNRQQLTNQTITETIEHDVLERRSLLGLVQILHQVVRLVQTDTTYSVTTGATEWDLSITTREAGTIETITIDRTIETDSTTNSYSIFATIGTPVFAEGEDTNVSNPVAAATGNVTNQAVQFQNNGASSRQIYGPNIQCNGSTMTFSPFYMGNHSKPLDEFMQPSSYTIAENWGFQINFMVPLDKSGYKQCKEDGKEI